MSKKKRKPVMTIKAYREDFATPGSVFEQNQELITHLKMLRKAIDEALEFLTPASETTDCTTDCPF